MGAAVFKSVVYYHEVTDSRVEQAFNHAKLKIGQRGYTGTIAEKDTWKRAAEIQPTLGEAITVAEEILDAENTEFDDKWGPAGYVEFTESEHGPGVLFFGWASC